MDHTPHCHYLQYVRNESTDGCRESLGIPILLSVRLSQEIRIEEGEQDFAEEPYPIIILRRRKFAKFAATDAKVFIPLLLFGEAWTSKRCLAGTLSLMVYDRLLKLRGTSLERGASTTVTRNTCPGFLSVSSFQFPRSGDTVSESRNWPDSSIFQISLYRLGLTRRNALYECGRSDSPAEPRSPHTASSFGAPIR